MMCKIAAEMLPPPPPGEPMLKLWLLFYVNFFACKEGVFLVSEDGEKRVNMNEVLLGLVFWRRAKSSQVLLYL